MLKPSSIAPVRKNVSTVTTAAMLAVTIAGNVAAQVPQGIPLRAIGSGSYMASNTILTETGVPGVMRDTHGNTYNATGYEVHQNPKTNTRTTYQVPISGAPQHYYHWNQLMYSPTNGVALSHDYARYTSFRVERIHMYQMTYAASGRPTISYADKLKASNPAIYSNRTYDVPVAPGISYMEGSHTVPVFPLSIVEKPGDSTSTEVTSVPYMAGNYTVPVFSFPDTVENIPKENKE